MSGDDYLIVSKYFTCEHRGGLYDAMKTERCITKSTFDKLINSGLYKFYAYDERIKSYVYIIDDMSHNLGLPVWLHRCKTERICGFYDDSLYKKYL